MCSCERQPQTDALLSGHCFNLLRLMNPSVTLQLIPGAVNDLANVPVKILACFLLEKRRR